MINYLHSLTILIVGRGTPAYPRSLQPGIRLLPHLAPIPHAPFSGAGGLTDLMPTVSIGLLRSVQKAIMTV
ncbi:MAG: hypothetical protein F6J93_40630 [Oscillatoria sp. SIO1A7]|nr:hypothetical protein [Oscillatoria sp. SIO1A7]